MEKTIEFTQSAWFFFFFFGVTGLEFRALNLQTRHSTPKATPPVHFGLVILEMGSYELFIGTGSNCDPPNLDLLIS
jgi:hypothetical protein